MECVTYTIEPEVPQEFTDATTSSTAFFRIPSSLEVLDGKEGVRKHTLLTTTQGHLIEVEGGKVQRSTPSPKDVTKIVVHHDFEPLQLYVVLLRRSGTALLLAYQDFKVLHEWEGVMDVSSEDLAATGTPKLILNTDIEEMVISNAKLMSFTGDGKKDANSDEDTPGKKEVMEALMHRFKGGIKHAEQLRTERKIKENFIAEELAALQCRLQGLSDEREKMLMPGVSEEGRRDEAAPSHPQNSVKILHVYHKLIHDKWVVGVNVMNDAESILVSDLEIAVWCGGEPMCHTSQVFKTVKHSRPQRESDSRITIETLDPPVLRPKKKVTVVAVCEVPSFESGPSLSCRGLLSYTCKLIDIGPRNAPSGSNECLSREYQVPVQVAELKASELHCHLASIDLCTSSKTACVTFSIVALVAASKCTLVSLTSLVSPLNTFLTRISRHLKLFKVSGVTDFYVVHPGETHPLHHSGFILHPIDSHHIDLKLYSKDEKQAMILAHTLLAALPKDASMQVKDEPNTTSPVMQPTNVHQTLLAKMKELTSLVIEGLEAQITKSNAKAPRVEGEGGKEDGFAKYTKEREELLARKGEIKFTGPEYSEWRNKLYDVQVEVDDLYLNFLKLNCATD